MSGPSFYGEVLPLSSRAVDEEEDEEDYETSTFSSSVLRWSPDVRDSIEKDGGLACNVLVVAIDPVATGFVQTHFLWDSDNVQRIGVICSGLTDNSVNSLDQEDFTDETCYIYRLQNEPSILFCQCNTKVQPEQAHSWVQQLFGGIKAVHTYVAVLSHKSVNDYRCEITSSQLKVPFLKALKTTHFQGAPLCGYLEQPNIIDGLPAQIMTYCQVRGISAVYYTCYTENMYIDTMSLTEFSKLTTVTPFKDIYKPNPRSDQDMRRLVEISNNSNTLYM